MSLVIGETIKASERLSLKPVLVVWEDAAQGGGWIDGEEVDPSDTIVESVGWLAESNAERVILIQSITDGSHAQTLQIPAGMIKQLVFLTPKVI